MQIMTMKPLVYRFLVTERYYLLFISPILFNILLKMYIFFNKRYKEEYIDSLRNFRNKILLRILQNMIIMILHLFQSFNF